MSKWICVLCFFVESIGAALHLSNGYRHDDLGRTQKLNGQTDRIDAPVNLWQVGLNGSYTPCRYPVFLTGFAYWGLGGCSDQLHERITLGSLSQTGRADLKNAFTSDYQIGLGYLYTMRCCNLALSGGYAYDRQKIQTKRGRISFPGGAPYELAQIYSSGYKTTTTWKGPWLGIELERTFANWRTGLGYEFHFADYKANHTIPQNALAQLQGFANQTKASRAYGNVLLLEGHYLMCRGLDFGLFFKYQNWHSCHGKMRSNYFFANQFPKIGASGTGRWISYQVSVDIGYEF